MFRALIQPLAAGAGAPLRSDWTAVAESSAGWVRELVPGDGRTQAPSVPDAWHEELVGELGTEDVSAPASPGGQDPDVEGSAPARQEVGPQPPTSSVVARASDGSSPVNAVMPALEAPPAETPSMAPVDGARRVASVRYKVQFTADQAYVDRVEQARALLWHRLPSGDLAELHRLALEALVDKLVSRKYGAAARSGRVETPRANSRDGAPATEERSSQGEAEGAPVERTDNPSADESSVATKTSSVIGPEATNGACPAPATSHVADSALARGQTPSSSASLEPDHEPLTTSGPSNSRHIPAAVRSDVWLRDEGRCTFVDTRGVRCRASAALELHHERPFARGGPPTAENIRLRCRAHNELAAEQDFGRELMLTKKRGRARPDMPPR